MPTEFKSLFDLLRAIPCRAGSDRHFTAIRWRDGEFCPLCGAVRLIHPFSDKRTHKCGDCRRRFSIKVGTICQDIKIPMQKWLMAVWMLTLHKGIARTQLAKDIDVTPKTAWFMLHRLRRAALTESFNAPLDGVVEADETFVGGKERNKHARDRVGGLQQGKGKAVIYGMLDRDGDLRAIHTANLRAQNVQGIIAEHVEEGSTLMTDEHVSFVCLSARYYHHRVNHSAGEYVRHFCIHTNGIESMWAVLKRQIIDIHHYVSPKHLSRYLDEMTRRFNRRTQEEGQRLNNLLAAADRRPLTYRELVA